MDSQMLKKSIAKILEKNIRKFDDENFRPVITKLVVSFDVANFVNDIYVSDELKVKEEDIIDILQSFADNPQLLKLFGNELVFFWLEFQIIDFCRLHHRLSQKELDAFPQKQINQISFLKDIVKKHKISYIQGDQTKLFQEISKKSIYQILCHLLKSAESGIKSTLKKSKIVDISRIKEDDIRILSLKFLKRILQTISVPPESNLQKETQQKLKDMFEEIIQKKDDVQMGLLQSTFREVIKNMLHIEVSSISCKIIDKQIQPLKQSFRFFKLFFDLQKTILYCDEGKQKVTDVIDKVQRILKETKSVWYWPNIVDETLIIFLRNRCFDDKQKMQELIETLNISPPNLISKMYHFSIKQFLAQAVFRIGNQSQKGVFVTWLFQEGLNQKIDFERQLSNSSCYAEMFEALNLPPRMLQKFQPPIQPNPNQFYIFDKQKKQKFPIFLLKEDEANLIDKIINDFSYQAEEFSCAEYHLKCDINKYQMVAKYCKLDLKTYQEQEFSGFLLLGNLGEYRDKLQDFKWAIIDLKGELVNLTETEISNIGSKLIKAIKDKINKITVHIGCLGSMIEINCHSLQVTLYSQDKTVSKSKLKHQFGYLISIPSFKSLKDAKAQLNKKIDEIYLPIQDIQAVQREKNIRKATVTKTTENYQQDSEEKYQNYTKTFKYLGLFSSQFDSIDGYTINQENHVQATKQRTIQYFERWRNEDLYKLLAKYLFLDSEVIIKHEVLRFQVFRRVQNSLKKQTELIEQKTKVKMYYDYNHVTQQLTIKNLKIQRKARDLFEQFLKYITFNYDEQQKTRSFYFKVNRQQQKYLQEKQNLEKMKLMRQHQGSVVIQSSKAEIQKLKKQLQALDDVYEFVYLNVRAFEMMKEYESAFLEEIRLKELQHFQNSFKVAYQMKYHPFFKNKFKQYCQKQQNLPGQTLQRRIQKQAPFIQLYRSKFALDPQIIVTKMNDDILLEYNSKKEKQMTKLLEQIQKEKQRQINEILRKQGSVYKLQSLEQIFIFALKNHIQACLKQIPSFGFNAVLNVQYNNQIDEYIFRPVNTTKQQQQEIQKLLKQFTRRTEEFRKMKQQIYDTNQYFNNTLNKIPSNGTYNQKIKKMIFQFKKKLEIELTQIVNKTTDQGYKGLRKQFSKYLCKNSYQNQFKSEIIQKTRNLLKKEIEEINIFGKYVIEKIEQAQKKSIVKNHTLKNKIIQQMEVITRLLEQKFKNGTIYPSQIKRFLKSLNILIIIFYGQQLPITSHLEQFKKKLDQNDIVMVKVGTGSGKSTVIPPYLVGLGYKKVVVTQPRRLPCTQIYKRITEVFGQGVAGFEVADSKRDTSNSLIYMTDGLLKMKEYFDQTVFDNIDVLVIDQIHQRSANIDLLLLLLTMYFKKKSENTDRKLKLVLCSATIDEKIENLFKKKNLKISSFFVKTEKFKVTQHPIKQGSIIDKIIELSKNMKADEQMLVFIPGEAEVVDIVTILSEKFKKLAHPLTARHSQRGQEDVLKNGQIFISTSIAETSLTFRNLKYVIDSRLSRWRKFNPELQLMETQESYSSKSSIQQRKGRLGRTCPGQYYYFEYHDDDSRNMRQHNVTELQRLDLTNFIFELLLSKKQTFKNVQELLQLLDHNKFQFVNKMNYSRQILQNSGILSKGNLTSTAQRMIKYGSLGNPLYNIALDNAAQKNFLVNMIYIISFQMYGIVVSEAMINYCKKLYKGGDIKVVHDFLIDIGNRINLITINPLQIAHELKNQCRSLIEKPWFRILTKIMIKAKDLLKTSSTNQVASPKEWPEILKTLAFTFKNRVFFNQSIFGGNQALYQKFKKKLIIDYESEKQPENQVNVSYNVNIRSTIYQRGCLPDVILSLNCEINAMSECVLSICQEITQVDRSFTLQYKLEGKECQEKYFVGTKPLKEQQIFNSICNEVKNKKGGIKINLLYPKLTLDGSFLDIVQITYKILDPKRKNQELKLDLNVFLEEAINKRMQKAKWNKLASVIDPDHSRRLFQKLDFADYERLFAAIRYEMKNKYGVDMKWDVKERSLKIENAKNIHLNKILKKVTSFFTWFSDCQIMSKEEYKIKPTYIGDFHSYKDDMKKKVIKVMHRVNQIVDSKLQHYVLKGWVNGKGPETKYARTARMIAVCWVLVNHFNCTIKGGFVRDWVVNSDEWLDLTVQERRDLLKQNDRNIHRQVTDDRVTPSDIDAELPQSCDFDPIRFKKQMKKLGIVVDIDDTDGWRKHIIFDDKTETGGFTADLIQPYTALTHYTYDFDANVMYLKKDHLNSIGMKLPLEYRDNMNKTSRKVQIYQLIELCMNKKMNVLKNDIPDYRFKKFEQRNWTINKQLIHPICYKSHFTISFLVPIDKLKDISPEFYKMVNDKHYKIINFEQLSNKSWDDAFESTQNFIINELQNEEKKKNNGKYNLKTINSNNRLLFHGTRTLEGAKGIKQSGFDSRYFSKSGMMYGKGAYFADDPNKSDNYTSPPLRYIFIVNVALGKQEVLTKSDDSRSGPKAGYHSILGQAGKHNEYIVDRWGQAKPMFLITYQ